MPSTDLLLRLATGRNVLIALAAMALGGTWLFNAGPFSQLAAFGAGPAPEETLTPAEILPEYLLALGQQGREVYHSHLIWDFLNPVLMAPFFLLLLAQLAKLNKIDHLLSVIAVLPTLLLLAEIVENSFLLIAVSSFPDLPSTSAWLTVSTLLKFISLGFCAISSLILGLMVIARKALNRQ